MVVRRTVSALAAAILAAGAIGCGATAFVESKKSTEYTKKLDRTLIVFRLDEKMQKYEQLLHERMVAELQKRGVASAFAKTTGDLDLKEATPVSQQAKDFNASSTLIILRHGGVVGIGGELEKTKFDAHLFDLASKNRVWRASIDYHFGEFNSDAQKIDTLVDELMQALSKDGLL